MALRTGVRLTASSVARCSSRSRSPGKKAPDIRRRRSSAYTRSRALAMRCGFWWQCVVANDRGSLRRVFHLLARHGYADYDLWCQAAQDLCRTLAQVPVGIGLAAQLAG